MVNFRLKKILIVSYLFAPAGGGGVIRTLKFVKFLPQFGFDVSVITPKKPFYSFYDRTLEKELPKDVKIIRINYFEPGLWFKWRYWQSFLKYFLYPLFLIPDNQALWILPAILKGYRLFKYEKIRLIYTSSAPVSDHLIGYFLKKITGVKWVADFRDEWANNPLKKYPTSIHRRIDRYLQKIVLSTADEIVTVSEPIGDYFKGAAKNPAKVSVITNGFDEDDFKEQKTKKNKVFDLVHVGSIYNQGYQKELSDAFQSLNLADSRLTFLGSARRVSHQEAIKRMSKADALLLVLDPVERPGVLTGKLFEYLRAKKPIIALAYKNSQAAKLIESLKVGQIVKPKQEAFKKIVLKMRQKWLKNELKVPEVNLEPFKRKNLAQNLSKIFEKYLKNYQKIKLCLIGNINSPQNQNLCRGLKKKNYEIHFLSTQPGKLEGVRVYYLGRNHFTPWYFFETALKIRSLIKRIKPDLVHGQDLVFAGIWSYLSGFHPLVATPWGSDVINYDRFIYPEKYLIKKALQQADAVTVSSEALRQKSIQIGMESKKAELIHFGIDTAIFKPKKLDSSKTKIIFSPRAIGPIYNTDILVKAFKILLEKNQDAKLVLLNNAADKNYYQEILELLKKNHLTKKVKFYNKVPNREMVSYYQNAAVVVTLASSDGCSVSFLEAMAMEKKIVATDLDYLQEWSKGNNIWKVPIRNVEETAASMIKALQFPEKKWQKIGQANRQMISEKAEIKSNVDKLDKLYRGLIN